MNALPYITSELDGIGGEIKTQPAHFVVQEIPLYEPAGQGPHVYVCLTREGWNTRALQKRLSKLFDLRQSDIGFAGLKDKHALATQTFSLPLGDLAEEKIGNYIQDNLPVEVLSVRRHRNKLKMGHLIGNHFRITVTDVTSDALTAPSVSVCAARMPGKGRRCSWVEAPGSVGSGALYSRLISWQAPVDRRICS